MFPSGKTRIENNKENQDLIVEGFKQNSVLIQVNFEFMAQQ